MVKSIIWYNFNMFINIIIFILCLSFIVLVHELGHLLAAKKIGVFCYEFSIGMGPKIFSKKFKETVYSIRLLPLGGYVAMAGEDEMNEELKDKYQVGEIPFERTLKGINKFKRIIIFLAGIFFNFLLAYLIFVGVILHQKEYRVSSEPIIKDVVKDGPAYTAGLKANDYIVSVEFSNGVKIKNPKTIDQVAIYIGVYGGEMEIKVKRNEKIETFNLTAIKKDNTNIIGITLPEANYVKVDLLNVWSFAANHFLTNINFMFKSVISLFKGIGLNQVSGPIGIYKISSEIASRGFIEYLNFIALFSINIGLINLLPIPAFDGGRVLLLLVEIIIGKKLNKKFESFIIAGSMILILMLMLLITFKDIVGLF